MRRPGVVPGVGFLAASRSLDQLKVSTQGCGLLVRSNRTKQMTKERTKQKREKEQTKREEKQQTQREEKEQNKTEEQPDDLHDACKYGNVHIFFSSSSLP